jgi:cytochrome P450
VAHQCDVTRAELAGQEAHARLAWLRARSPVCGVPALNAGLVTGYAAAAAVLADPATFTVDDPRFTTARVVGPSMLSLDGDRHARHRKPFVHAFQPAQLRSRLAGFTEAEAVRLTTAIRPAGQAELRTAVAGPLAAAVMTEALGLAGVGLSPGTVLAWYRDIVAVVAALPAGGAGGQLPAGGAGGSSDRVTVASFTALATGVRAAIASGRAPLLSEAAGAGTLTDGEVVSNAAVELFGGIETTEGMIANALLHLLSDPEHAAAVRADPALVPAAIEESLRLEPAAAVVDRYATREAVLHGAVIGRGDPVIVSIAGANRDPEVFPAPGRYDFRRPNAARHLAFARGPHFCLGAPLARLEAIAAVRTLFALLPGLRLAGGRAPAATGFVFRKPEALPARWDEPGSA